MEMESSKGLENPNVGKSLSKVSVKGAQLIPMKGEKNISWWPSDILLPCFFWGEGSEFPYKIINLKKGAYDKVTGLHQEMV